MTVIFLHLLLEELISTAPKAASRTCRGLGKIYRAITYVSLIFIPSQCNSSSTSRVDENCLCRSVDSSSVGVLLLFVSQSIQFPSLHCSHVREKRHIRESGVSKVGKQCLYTSYSCLQHPNDSKHTFDFHSRQPYMDEWLRTHALRSYGWIPYRCFLLLLGVLLFASLKLYNIQIKFETSNRLMHRISIN